LLILLKAMPGWVSRLPRSRVWGLRSGPKRDCGVTSLFAPLTPDIWPPNAQPPGMPIKPVTTAPRTYKPRPVD